MSGCSNLKRVYGNVSINVGSCFRDCSSFSILGSDVNTATFDGESAVTSNGIIRHFTDGETGEDRIKFNKRVQGDKVTNMTFGSTSASYAFYGTNCTAFDAYYILWNIGSATNLSNIFAYVKQVMFGGADTSANNSPHRSMFTKCGKVTNLQSAFGYNRGSGNKNIVLYGPSETEEGLFGYLKACTNIALIF